MVAGLAIISWVWLHVSQSRHRQWNACTYVHAMASVDNSETKPSKLLLVRGDWAVHVRLERAIAIQTTKKDRGG